MRKWVGGVLLVGGVVVALGELLNLVASRAPRPPAHGSVAVVVLGYPTRKDGSAHFVQRVRVETAIAVARAYGAERVVMSGGAVRRDVSEAETMAAVARELGFDADRISTDVTSRNTWENVANSAPLVQGAETVVIVSDPMHAARARRYWQRQFPDDADRDLRGSDRRLLEQWWLTTPAAFYELAIAIRDRIRFGI